MRSKLKAGLIGDRERDSYLTGNAERKRDGKSFDMPRRFGTERAKSGRIGGRQRQT